MKNRRFSTFKNIFHKMEQRSLKLLTNSMQQGMITRTAPKPNTGDFEILKASSTV
jgi:hypothetical protein